jgi:hypothetical protein
LGEGGFLKRLLLSKPAADDDEACAPLLSHMQTLGLHVASALGQAGGASVRRQLASALSSTVTGLAAALLDAGAAAAPASLPAPALALDVGPDAAAAFEDLWECLHALLVDSAADRPAPLPAGLVPTLVRFLRCCPPEDTPLAGLPLSGSAAHADDGDRGGDAQRPAAARAVGSRARCASLALALVAHALLHPADAGGSHAAAAVAVGNLEAVASLCDGVGVASVDRRGNWTPAAAAELRTERSEGAPQVALGLSLLLHWGCARVNQPPLDHATKTALEVRARVAATRLGAVARPSPVGCWRRRALCCRSAPLRRRCGAASWLAFTAARAKFCATLLCSSSPWHCRASAAGGSSKALLPRRSEVRLGA